MVHNYNFSSRGSGASSALRDIMHTCDAHICTQAHTHKTEITFKNDYMYCGSKNNTTKLFYDALCKLLMVHMYNFDINELSVLAN